jgi:hypothetical protein
MTSDDWGIVTVLALVFGLPLLLMGVAMLIEALKK